MFCFPGILAMCQIFRPPLQRTPVSSQSQAGGAGEKARRGRGREPWGKVRRSPRAPAPPCQFGEGIKKFLFNYFFLENY